MYADRLVGYISRDATAIESREKVARAPDDSHAEMVGPFKRGRPKKDEIRPVKERGPIEKQLGMTLDAMPADLPKGADIGGKKNSQGHSGHWIGYKLHMDVDDLGTPISA